MVVETYMSQKKTKLCLVPKSPFSSDLSRFQRKPQDYGINKITKEKSGCFSTLNLHSRDKMAFPFLIKGFLFLLIYCILLFYIVFLFYFSSHFIIAEHNNVYIYNGQTILTACSKWKTLSINSAKGWG